MSPRTRETLHHHLTAFFHDELDRRYRQERLREIPGLREEELLQAVPEEQLIRIKEFFKRVMYPIGEERQARDRGVETVERILGSTSSLISLLPRLPAILVRHGGRLPAIASAGLTVVSTYRLARRMEEKVLTRLEELCETEAAACFGEEGPPEELLRRAYGSLTEADTGRMLERTEKVVRLGMDERLMESTIDIVEIVQRSREDPEEQDALKYVSSVLNEVRSLAEEYSREQVERILRISEITEGEYFEALREEA
ncbi:MAG: hypothetical protein ACOC47_07590 [Alkalispirochaetaceae bacterium]